MPRLCFSTVGTARSRRPAPAGRGPPYPSSQTANPVLSHQEVGPMNPWLITWVPLGESAEATVKNLIAAILPNQTAEREVKTIMHLLYANYNACPGPSDRPY